MLARLVCAVILTVCVVSAVPANFIKKCKTADSKCIKESTLAAIQVFAAGIPELGVEALDPLFFEELNASSPNLKLILRDLTIEGLKNCIPKKVQRDGPKSKLYVRFTCDVVANGKYDMKGSLLIVPIEGNDKIYINMKKLNIAVDLDMIKRTGDDGVVHWDIKNWIHSYELKEKTDLRFDNLFPGNEILGRAARELVANSANEIVLEVGSPVIKSIVDRIVKTIAKYLQIVSYDDISLD